MQTLERCYKKCTDFPPDTIPVHSENTDMYMNLHCRNETKLVLRLHQNITIDENDEEAEFNTTTDKPLYIVKLIETDNYAAKTILQIVSILIQKSSPESLILITFSFS